MATADLEHLAEGQRLTKVDLTRAQAAALNRTRLVTALPDVDGWRVTAEHTVGVVKRGDLVVRVTPKVGTVQVLTLLARARGIRGLKIDDERVPVAPDADLSEVLAVLFAQEAATAMAGGPLRGYRSEDQTLPVLRGRVRLREQHLRRFGLLVPIEVTVDEWTLDTDDNRRLKAAAVALLGLSDVPAHTRQGVLRLDRLLADVHLPPTGARLAAWTPTRLNVRFHRLLHLADLVLEHAGVEHAPGDTETHGFVVNMAWLFETLVAQLLWEVDHGWSAQEAFPLVDSPAFQIKPDLTLHSHGVKIAVADTKYKLLGEDGKIPNSDIYQLVTYCARLGLRHGHLIYASGEPCPEPFSVIGTDIVIHVHALDLTQPVDQVETHVNVIASAISAAVPDESSNAAEPGPFTTLRSMQSSLSA